MEVLQGPTPFPAPRPSAELSMRPHRSPHSHRGLDAWWVSPAAGASCGCGASGQARQLRGQSRSDRLSSSWCTPGHRAPLQSRRGLAMQSPRKATLPSLPDEPPISLPLHSSQLGCPRVLLRRSQHKTLRASDREQVSFDRGGWREVRGALRRCPMSREQRFR